MLGPGLEFWAGDELDAWSRIHYLRGGLRDPECSNQARAAASRGEPPMERAFEISTDRRQGTRMLLVMRINADSTARDSLATRMRSHQFSQKAERFTSLFACTLPAHPQMGFCCCRTWWASSRCTSSCPQRCSSFPGLGECIKSMHTKQAHHLMFRPESTAASLRKCFGCWRRGVGESLGW